MFDFYEHIADLSAEERALLTTQLNPLSFAQQRLWFLDQLQPGNPAYNISTSWDIGGSLNIAALEQALKEIVRRHDIMRTTIVTLEGKPYQVVSPPPSRVLALVDLGDLPEVERWDRVTQLATEEARVSFDLAHGPLFRPILLRLDRDSFTLLLTMHHIISDDWSMGILIREITAFYKAFSRGQPSPLSELPIQYADFACWQREWLQGKTLESQLLYWKQKLGDYSSLPRFLTDYPRPAVQTYRGERQYIILSGSLSQAVKSLSQREGVTLFMTLSAVFKTLLYRYTGQEDIAVGSPIANRNRLEIEGLIGFFANTLVFRTKLQGNMSFQELLRRVQQIALEAYAHQDLPFEKLVEEISPERNPDHSPLFHVMFVMQNTPREVSTLSGLTFRPRRIQRGTTQFDLTLIAREVSEGIILDLTYNTDLLDFARMTRLLGHYRVLLASIVANPQQKLSNLTMLPASERKQLLLEWNDTRKDYALTGNIPGWFEDQEQRTPDNIAVVFRDEQITYRQLDRKANGEVFLLKAHGLKKGSFIPVIMESCIEIVYSFLAIMKIGAVFVPLDPLWAPERQKEVLNQLNSQMIIGNKKTIYHEELLRCSYIYIDQQTAEPAPSQPVMDIRHNSPIYTLYTSGSTGKPKGVVVPHRGITNRFMWMNEFFGVETAAVVLQTTRHVYDSAVWQLFWPLTNGGRAIMMTPDMEFSAENLAALIHKHRVTLTDFVPSIFDMIAPRLGRLNEKHQSLPSLKSIIIGGEAITPSTTYAFREQFPDVRLINLYGPTEATIGCIFFEVKGKKENKIPIGKPISNVKALILDQHMNPVPIGSVGELYLSGLCLGLGYLENVEKTRAVFLENPFPEIPDNKLYKTGDLARYLADGNIEFLGRSDHQVKLRGYRVELGEIEIVLTRHPTVREAVVIVREDATGDKYLTAYVTAQMGKDPDTRELRNHVKEKLPAYMVPAVVMVLEALPLTAGGKVDRRVLPAPDKERLVRATSYVRPRTSVEEILTEMWAQVLEVKQVGIYDDFFELGGHSLLATRIISRIRDTFQVEVPLRSLFKTPTPADIAEIITGNQGRQNEQKPDSLSRIIPKKNKNIEQLLAEVETNV
ncbi:MAG: amino acid adenylation domain-containing protein [Candidatus Aminicenantes bacterium]|jgi:aspartate racemase